MIFPVQEFKRSLANTLFAECICLKILDTGWADLTVPGVAEFGGDNRFCSAAPVGFLEEQIAEAQGKRGG